MHRDRDVPIPRLLVLLTDTGIKYDPNLKAIQSQVDKGILAFVTIHGWALEEGED